MALTIHEDSDELPVVFTGLPGEPFYILPSAARLIEINVRGFMWEDG